MLLYLFYPNHLESHELRDRILEELENIKRKGNSEIIPPEFLCPITTEVMKNPVIAAGGLSSSFWGKVFKHVP